MIRRQAPNVKNTFFLLFSLLFLTLNFHSNFLGIGNAYLIANFDTYSEALVIGKLARSEKDGVFVHSGFTGVNYDKSIISTEADVLAEVYTHQLDYYLGNNETPSEYSTYRSQTGGQAILFSIINSFLPFEKTTNLDVLRLVNAFLTVLCFVVFIGWVSRNFGLLSAIIILILISLSTWLIMFSHNLWWALWSFYIPFLTMLLLLERNYKADRKMSFLKIGCFLFVAVFFKCIFTGFEFISTTLIALMCPAVFYFFLEKKRFSNFILFSIKAGLVSIAAIIAEMLVLLVQFRFYVGSYTAGIEHIIFAFTRRTNDSHSEYSYYPYSYIITKYLKGNVFEWGFLSQTSAAFHFVYLIAIIVVLGTMVYYFSRNLNEYYKRLNISLLITTAVSFLAPLSWFIVFRQHSANHTHLDYIVWYMPFLLLGFLIIGVGISLILYKLGVYKGRLAANSDFHN